MDRIFMGKDYRVELCDFIRARKKTLCDIEALKTRRSLNTIAKQARTDCLKESRMNDGQILHWLPIIRGVWCRIDLLD